MAAQQVRANQLAHFQRNLLLIQADGGQPGHGGQGIQQLIFGNVGALDDQFTQASAAFLQDLAQLIGLLIGQQIMADQVIE